jgi:hypothetical protein
MLGSIHAGVILLADRAYDPDALRQELAARGAWVNVKPMPHRRNVPASAHSSIATVIWSSVSSISSSTSAPSPPATTNVPTTISPP